MSPSSKTLTARPSASGKKPKHTINLTKEVSELVDAEARIEVPAEPLPRSLMTRVLIREAINARRKTRGEAPLPR